MSSHTSWVLHYSVRDILVVDVDTTLFIFVIVYLSLLLYVVCSATGTNVLLNHRNSQDATLLFSAYSDI